jgi:hypothetical protein
VVATKSNCILDGSQSGTQPPRIAMQRIWTARQVNVACGPKFCLPFDEKKTFEKSQYFTKVVRPRE